MIGTYASAIVICLVALLLGRGICALSGYRQSPWLAAPVGFAALMVVCEVAITLPGRGWTAVGVVVGLSAASVWFGARRSAPWPSWSDGLAVGAVVLGITTIPFLVNARVGVLGISFLNDTHWHLFLAQGLLQPAIRPLDTYGFGYPLGPHSVAATFAQGLGTSVDRTLTGVLIATPVLTGLAALGALRGLSWGRRCLVAIVAAMPYLAAAAYAESAFKEPIMSLLLLGIVLVLQSAHRERFSRPVAVVVPLVVLIAGVLYDYSYPGLVWPLAVLACWLVLEFVIGHGWRSRAAITTGLRTWLPALGVGAAVALALIAPNLHRLYNFWQGNGGTAAGTTGGVVTSSLANLAGPLQTLEGFNIWLYGDFRFPPPDALQAGALAGFALILVVFAIVRALERRDLAWLGAVLGLGLVYAYAKHSQSPYVAAKALTIPGPLLALGVGGALMRDVDRRAWRSLSTWAVGGAAIAFFVFALESESLVLRDAQVGPSDHTSELRSLRPLLHGQPTLVLFYDDYFKWELLGVPVSSPLGQSPVSAPVWPEKPWSYGQALDFDSVSATTLDRFVYVITTRTSAQSDSPPNFHLVGGSRSYEVWRRVGPTAPFQVLPESGHPGAILDCKTPQGRTISREHGVATVRPAPVYSPVAPLLPGGSTQVVLHLAPGEWDLSLPFVSAQSVTVRGTGLDVRLPPNLDRPGEIWPVGRVTSTGAPVLLSLKMADPGLGSSTTPATDYFAPQPMVAARVIPARSVALSSACGRYVDSYRLR